MHLAEEDEFISKAAQAEIKTALANKPNVTIYSYSGQHHAFARHNGAHYNAAAAALANGRTSDFLHRHLRRPSVAPAASGLERLRTAVARLRSYDKENITSPSRSIEVDERKLNHG